MNTQELLARTEESLTQTFPYTGRLRTGVDLGTAFIVLTVVDETGLPVACEMQYADVLRDGVVLDYMGALNIVKELKERLEHRLGCGLDAAAIAMPSGTDSSVHTHKYVAEGAGFTVTAVLDEPTAANSVFGIEDGAVVDIGGGTTGLAIFKGGKAVRTEDEATGGTHFTLVIAGSRKISFEEAEQLKRNPAMQAELFPAIRPVISKMGSIILKYIEGYQIDTIYLCGGTCCFQGFAEALSQDTGKIVILPSQPLFVTPLGIALNCL